MDFVFFGLSGLLGGILGGMGMGGGTVLIPLLTIFLGVGQHIAQGVNLLCFIPMAVVSLVVHAKNKLIDFKDILLIILPGIVTCLIGCFVAKNLSGNVLSRCFGGFLVLLSIFQFVNEFRKKKE